MLLLTGCDDLNPSSEDKRTPAESGTIGPNVGQTAPDFSLFDTLGNPVTMSAELVDADGIVMYFTMWCPICDSHMSHMRSRVIPNFPNVKFFFIDFVSGTIDASRAEQLNNGYADVTVLVDNTQDVKTLYEATMGTTVVIDSIGIVRMNEDYKDGVKLTEVLTALP
jgi:peroxiredoxin